jgi:predicted peptidase
MRESRTNARAAAPIAAILATLSLTACARADTPAPGPSANGRTGFIEQSIPFGDLTKLYRVYLPDDYSPRVKWPVVLFLHGAAERGTDNERQLTGGLAPAMLAHRERFECLVVFPQIPSNANWSDTKMLDLALAELDATIEDMNGDPDRVVLTGKSLGGTGVFEMALRHAGRFAAIAPIAAATGGLAIPDLVRSIGKTPAWIFHGAEDPTAPVAGAREMKAALDAAGASVRYTEYPGGKHNVWDQAYADPEFTAWLLGQKRAH